MSSNNTTDTTTRKREVRPGEGRRAGEVRRSTKQMRLSQDWLDYFTRMSLRTGKSPGECAEEVAKMNRLHVRAVVQGFLTLHNAENKTNFVIHDESEPFVAIVKDANNQLWVEVADVFIDDAHERLLYELALNDTREVQSSGVKVNPDENFAQQVLLVLDSKLSNESYQALYKAYGPGALIVSLHNPLFGDHALAELESQRKSWLWRKNTGYFGQVYLYEDSKFMPW